MVSRLFLCFFKRLSIIIDRLDVGADKHVKRTVFLHLESILRDYPKMNDYIDKRIHNIYYSPDDDRAVASLRIQQSVVKECLAKSSEPEIELIDTLYFHHDPNKTLDGIAYDLHISPSTLFYRRNKFLESMRRGLGW